MSNKPCLLVVEDDHDSAVVIGWMLKSQQLETVIVSSAEAALEQIRKLSKIRAILIDLALPQMDGFELLAHVKGQAATGSIPTIAMTAFHTPELRQKALNSGFDAFIPKPIDQDALLKAIAQVLG